MFGCIPAMSAALQGATGLKVSLRTPTVPLVAGLRHSPAELIIIQTDRNILIDGLNLNLSGSTDMNDISEVAIYATNSLRGYCDAECLGTCKPDGRKDFEIKLSSFLAPSDTLKLLVGLTLKDSIDLRHHTRINITEISTNRGSFRFPARTGQSGLHRIGVALHTTGAENVSTCRIPGIATAGDGSLIAIFDARHESARDLQGDIDIAFKRSSDGGATWSPLRNILDMGEWGGLPQRYNGVSDACILRDPVNNRLFVAGLWMHGVLDKSGKWIEGIDENSTYWIHQWKGKGSQPGLGIKETCQFLISHSDDNGLTWSEPRNITAETKRPEWWLYAPAPGQGIALRDGTLVIPSQGRDENGTPFSNITYSKDHGLTWTASNQAWNNVTECNAAELSNGDIMLNMRDNRNRGQLYPNGRRVCTTPDLGCAWTEHPTSQHALTEPTCMASLYRFDYTASDNSLKSVLLFCNPDDHKLRHNMTLKASFDDGESWQRQNSILFDETKGWGYSSITTIDSESVGILYESGLADLVFIRIALNEFPGFQSISDLTDNKAPL